ncbi:hypothetical protein K2173_021761 [Erythroxylum novogranatense]|uniref:Legumain prodomain domain-containing protein n=1 Tax=Erythroxylum novogranatense TaxID=1862640 RepID=A0AAV8TV50_9ROSI|nr:hypothetical protein K2173_021761 [Erythroxylum novogranatense]
MVSYGNGLLVLFLALVSPVCYSEKLTENSDELPSVTASGKSTHEESATCNADPKGKRWAVLIAGSREYSNYRHQADICHAYQLLRKGGLKEENIIVFMYDDIAYNPENPKKGIIINRPGGEDVYHGVPKDYTGKNATLHNLFTVLLNNKTGIRGGSGKALASGPNDHVFIYYTDHGAPGLVSFIDENLYAKDLIKVLKQMHQAKAYKSLVFYLEACESGSMFEGLLPSNINIYAMTASNKDESSYATYCPGEHPGPPAKYDTCLGDLFSVAWMEDCDLNDSSKETLQRQYEVAKKRTASNGDMSSHVMQYGNKKFCDESLCVYLGPKSAESYKSASSSPSNSLTQRDASLRHFIHKVNKAPEGSQEKVEAQKKLQEVLAHRQHVDSSINHIVTTIHGTEQVSEIMNSVRPSGLPLVDDWDCLKNFVTTYEKHCGPLSWYGKKYTRVMANMCNAGVKVEQMAVASTQACSSTA